VSDRTRLSATDHTTEPICEVLPIISATYYDHLARRVDPARLLGHAKRDEELRPDIQRVFDANWQVSGVRKIWRQLRRKGGTLPVTLSHGP
jgi:hypothetical protein